MDGEDLRLAVYASESGAVKRSSVPWHRRYQAHTAWMPQPCTWNSMNAAWVWLFWSELPAGGPSRRDPAAP